MLGHVCLVRLLFSPALTGGGLRDTHESCAVAPVAIYAGGLKAKVGKRELRLGILRRLVKRDRGLGREVPAPRVISASLVVGDKPSFKRRNKSDTRLDWRQWEDGEIFFCCCLPRRSGVWCWGDRRPGWVDTERTPPL